jgi:hypothetical protein
MKHTRFMKNLSVLRFVRFTTLDRCKLCRSEPAFFRGTEIDIISLASKIDAERSNEQEMYNHLHPSIISLRFDSDKDCRRSLEDQFS